MDLNHNSKNSLKGFLLNTSYDIKTLIIIGCSIALGISLANLIIVASLVTFTDGVSSSNSGALYSGLVTMLITLGISIFVSTSNSEICKKFVFPINRSTYAIGNYIYILVASFLLMVAVSAVQIIELLLGNLLEIIYSNVYFANFITIEDYLVGFWVSFCYMVFFASLIYLLSMCFHRYKIQFTTVLVLMLVLVFSFSEVRDIFASGFRFIFSEESIGLLSVKLLILSVVFNTVAYLPFKRMEVKK